MVEGVLLKIENPVCSGKKNIREKITVREAFPKFIQLFVSELILKFFLTDQKPR